MGGNWSREVLRRSSLQLSGAALAQTDSSVIAEVGGTKLTTTDLDKQESSKLLQARNSYYQAQSKALEDLIDKTLLEQKAKSEHLTVAQLADHGVFPHFSLTPYLSTTPKVDISKPAAYHPSD